MDGEKLRYWRMARGWTQDQLAERAKTTNVAVSQIELGKRQARAGMLARLAAALDVDPRELMRAPPGQPPPTRGDP